MAPPESDDKEVTDLYPFDIDLAATSKKLDDIGSPIGYYDRKAQRIDFARYAHLLEVGDPAYGPTGFDYKVVARSTVGPFAVSTVWLGLDHGFGFRPGPPIIFETMVFAREFFEEEERELGEFSHDFDCQRYASEEEAQAGHKEMVELVAATIPGDPEIVWNSRDE